jgi:hypothetical protein
MASCTPMEISTYGINLRVPVACIQVIVPYIECHRTIFTTQPVPFKNLPCLLSSVCIMGSTMRVVCVTEVLLSILHTTALRSTSIVVTPATTALQPTKKAMLCELSTPEEVAQPLAPVTQRLTGKVERMQLYLNTHKYGPARKNGPILSLESDQE